MLLDLSAAFDTVDHDKLLNILRREIGVCGVALQWFTSYLKGRCQRVKIGTFESADITIRFGVPQGSVLGPILFNLGAGKHPSPIDQLIVLKIPYK